MFSHRSWRLIFLLFSRQPNRIQSLPLSCSRSLIGLGGRFSCYFLVNQTSSRLNFSIILPPIRYFFYFSRFRCFKNLFLISLFFLRLEFWPYFVIRWEDFELLWFFFLNLKCYVKIEFVVLCIAHAQNTKTLHSLIQNVNLIFLNSCKMVSYTQEFPSLQGLGVQLKWGGSMECGIVEVYLRQLVAPRHEHKLLSLSKVNVPRLPSNWF